MNRLLAFLFVVSLAVACRPATPMDQLVRADIPRVESPDVSDAQVAQVVAGNQAFAFDLCRVLAAEKEGNLVYSPYSISFAFSMLYAGAQGAAEVEMARVLHFSP